MSIFFGVVIYIITGVLTAASLARLVGKPYKSTPEGVCWVSLVISLWWLVILGVVLSSLICRWAELPKLVNWLAKLPNEDEHAS